MADWCPPAAVALITQAFINDTERSGAERCSGGGCDIHPAWLVSDAWASTLITLIGLNLDCDGLVNATLKRLGLGAWNTSME